MEETEDSLRAGQTLWVDKYAPKSFSQLLSAEKTNREVLKALKLWDAFVFKTGVVGTGTGAGTGTGVVTGAVNSGSGLGLSQASNKHHDHDTTSTMNRDGDSDNDDDHVNDADNDGNPCDPSMITSTQHPFTQLPIYFLVHPLNHSLIHIKEYFLMHPLTHPVTYSLTHHVGRTPSSSALKQTGGSKSKQRARPDLRPQQRIILLAGPPGTGKTHLVTSLDHIIEHNKPSQYPHKTLSHCITPHPLSLTLIYSSFSIYHPFFCLRSSLVHHRQDHFGARGGTPLRVPSTRGERLGRPVGSRAERHAHPCYAWKYHRYSHALVPQYIPEHTHTHTHINTHTSHPRHVRKYHS